MNCALYDLDVSIATLIAPTHPPSPCVNDANKQPTSWFTIFSKINLEISCRVEKWVKMVTAHNTTHTHTQARKMVWE